MGRGTQGPYIRISQFLSPAEWKSRRTIGHQGHWSLLSYFTDKITFQEESWGKGAEVEGGGSHIKVLKYINVQKRIGRGVKRSLRGAWKPWNKISILFQGPGVNKASDAPKESQMRPAKQTNPNKYWASELGRHTEEFQTTAKASVTNELLLSASYTPLVLLFLK